MEHLISPDLLYGIAGFCVGILVGMTGVGGGSLMTPLLNTPAWEAAGWRERLTLHAHGYVFARQGYTVTTPVGTFSAYLDEESILIGRHRPALNRNMHR